MAGAQKTPTFLAVAAIAAALFASLAVDGVFVDTADGPPKIVAPEESVVSCAWVDGGILIGLAAGEDVLLSFDIPLPASDVGWTLLDADGNVLAEGTGFCLPCASHPSAAFAYVCDLGGGSALAGISRISARDGSGVPAVESAGPAAPVRQSGSVRGADEEDEPEYPGLGGEFTVKVSIGPSTEGFTLFGFEEPGGTTNMTSIPVFSISSPGQTNACGVSASGGWFMPDRTGYYSFQVEGDDEVSLSVGQLTASSSWPSNTPGEKVTGLFSAGVRYPVSFDVSSVGGPAAGAIPVFAEFTPLTNQPRIVVSPREVRFSPKMATAGIAIASQIGEGDEGVAYEINCISHSPGLSVTDATATPDLDSTVWTGTNTSATAVFGLFEDGRLIDTDKAVFTFMPEKVEECDCDCNEGTTVDTGCVSFSQRFGRTPWIAALPSGRLAIEETLPARRLWTPQALVYDHPMRRRVAVRRDSNPLDAVILDPFGHGTEYVGGRPSNMSAGSLRGLRLNDDGLLVEVLEDRTEITYSPDGSAASIRPPDGEDVAVADLGIDVFCDASGAVTSVVSRADGRLDVTAISANEYSVVWRGRNALPVKTFTFSGDGVSTFHLHEYRNAQFQFDTEWTYDDEVQDWTICRAPGSSAALTRAKTISFDDATGEWIAAYRTIDSTGGVVRTETARINVIDGKPVETQRSVGGKTLHAATRNSAGLIANETDSRGFLASYLYDSWNRLTSETSTVKGSLTRTVVYQYPTSSAQGGVIERRPSRRTVALNGTIVEDEETEYGDGYMLRIRTSGGLSRRAYREFDAQGRSVLSVEESGKAVETTYSEIDETDYSWTETSDEGVWTDAGGFSLVEGKSKRRHTRYDSAGNAISETLFALVGGEWRELSWTTNTYSATHKPVSTLKSNGKSSAADWICTGPVWQANEDGTATTNTYDAAKQLASSARHGPFGTVTTTFVRDADGRIIAETDAASGCETRTRLRSYDDRGRIVSETDEQGLVTTYSYSADDLTTTMTLPAGATRVTTLNPDGSLASVTGSAAAEEYYSYGVTTNGLEWTKINYLAPDGARWEKTYRNAFGETVREERPGANGAMLVTERTYNDKGQLVSTVTTGQPAETRAYDDWGDVVSVTRTADGVTRTVETATANALVDGEVWQISSRAASCSDPSIVPLVTTNMTQVSGLSLVNEARQASIDVRGNASETWSEFDPATLTRLTYTSIPTAANIALSESVDGVTTLSVSHSAVTNLVAYDAFRRAVIETDGRGNATTNAYDALGRLASTTDPTGATTSYAYDAAGRLAAVTNALGVATVYMYDARGNKTYEGGGSYPVTYAYDAFNVMTNMTTYRNAGGPGSVPASGDTTTWTYDEATGLLLAKTYADGNGPTYTYADNGNLATRTWARGVITSYTYDGWNNLTNTAYSDGTRPMEFAYDALGRQVYAKDEGGITTTSYNATGEVASEHTTGRLYTRTLSRHRDAYGRDIGYSLNNSRKTVMEYETDTGRIRRIQNAGVWFTYYYLQGTDLKSRLQYGGSGSAYYTYEPNRDLLTQVRNYINGGVISQYDYVNDAAGRRTEISRSGSMMSEARTDAYGYNDRSELILATKNTEDTEYQYSYDDIGNRITSLDLGTNRTYVANALNQYTSISNLAASALSAGETFIPAFDLDGNQTLVRTSTGDWQVTYNAENRPVLWTRASDGKTIEMLFDRMGRRVEYVESANGVTNAHHRFVYDGYLCIQRLDATANNLIELSFAWDPTEPVATRPLVMQRNGGWNFFYTHDGNKNVSEVVSFQQARGVPAHYEYAPFGAVTAATRNTNITAFDVRSLNPYRFSSEYADDALGLVYYNYRHYEPVIGRWLSRDAARFRDRNLYLICENRVFGCYDRLGLVPEIIEHEPGEAPPGGWQNERVAAETHLSRSSFIINFKSCSDGKVKLEPSFEEIRIDIYFGSVADVVQHRNDEYDHVACYINFRNSAYIIMGVLNLLPCICPDKAYEVAQNAIERYDQAVNKCDECNRNFDRIGGPHGH
ncbi:MAG: RHS repeat protein [Kiritimatiellae bacterium]|nr:RHS repeat protein [Kiritimatiellia bacterium]